MRKPEIVIKTNGITGTEIYIDGRKLDGVTGFRFSQDYKENSGLPRLQIDLKATNVTLETQMLPELPYPYNSHYVSIADLLESRKLTKADINEICEKFKPDLEVL